MSELLLPPEKGLVKPSKLLLPLSPAVLAPLPTVAGGYQCLLADPAWYFRSYAAVPNHHSSRAVERHYRTMQLQEIIDMPVRQVVARDAHLWLWTTGPYLEKCFGVARSWGFRYSGSGLVWIKLNPRAGRAQYELRTLQEWIAMLHTGLGFTTRKNAEFCLLFRRGSARRLAKDVHEVIISPRREHSRKPDETYERIERYCAGPRLELFARTARPGWDAWGNEVDKFPDGAA